MSFDVIQWHHPFWGMFQVQCAVYTSCLAALFVLSVLKADGRQMLRQGVLESRGLLSCSILITVIANLLSAVVFQMNTPSPIVIMESAGVLLISVAGLFKLFRPFLSSPASISDMQPGKTY